MLRIIALSCCLVAGSYAGVYALSETAGERDARLWAESLRELQARSEIGDATVMPQTGPMACADGYSRKDHTKLWASHPRLPCFHYVTVVSLVTGKEVMAVVMDRGEMMQGYDGEVIGVTPAVMRLLGGRETDFAMKVRISWIPNSIERLPAKRRR